MTTQRMTWTGKDSPWQGEFQGRQLDSDVSVIFNSLKGAGEGPRLHRHPYSETFIVRRGTVIFCDGKTGFEATAGEIVVVPAGMPHKFTTKSENVEMLDIHASPDFMTEWLAEATISRNPAKKPRALGRRLPSSAAASPPTSCIVDDADGTHPQSVVALSGPKTGGGRSLPAVLRPRR